MARKRIIDPEFWSDEEIGQWSFEARLFYIGLWNFADDEGRFKAAAALLKAQIFPYDVKIDIERLKRELNHKILWYEVDSLQYGFICNFNKHQRIDRPLASKLPAPPCSSMNFVEGSTNCSESSTKVPPNIREENIREEKGSAKAPAVASDEDFIKNLKTNKAYAGIDIDRELGKMDAWLSMRPQRKKTRRFIINWLNKIDKPVQLGESHDSLRAKFGLRKE